MKKITSIIIALVLVVSCMPFMVNAEVATQIVTIAAPSDPIEVAPGDTYVPVTWTITENQGWAAFKMYVEFDGDVFSFAPGGRTNRPTVPGSFGFFLYHEDVYAAMDNIGVVTTNIYGIDNGVDPNITKDKSALLVENASNYEDSTATGSFFTAFLNIAPNAPSGEYKIKITTDPNNCSSIKGSSVAKPVMTWGEATVIVKGNDDERLTVEGAQVRLASGETTQGLRFISNIDVELYNSLKEAGHLPTSSSSTGVGFGTVVLPESMIPEGEALTKETEHCAIVPAVKLFAAPGAEDTVYRYTACITGITESRYDIKYTVRPYVTYMDGDEEVTVYGEQYSASIFDIAEAAYLSGKETQSDSEYLLNKILSKVDPVKYPAQNWSGIYKP